uniref:(northern house mosquito) hypothetical protein n=1 Tax=Culex pipiens TaxID=7175 RepID=A0A8D8NQ97_CULPI
MSAEKGEIASRKWVHWRKNGSTTTLLVMVMVIRRIITKGSLYQKKKKISQPYLVFTIISLMNDYNTCCFWRTVKWLRFAVQNGSAFEPLYSPPQIKILRFYSEILTCFYSRYLNKNFGY